MMSYTGPTDEKAILLVLLYGTWLKYWVLAEESLGHGDEATLIFSSGDVSRELSPVNSQIQKGNSRGYQY